ncbi:hypothetical protein B0H13DRAFT_912207 [Mycena leptocephala]|nr:hypothetical protein B0H13DRAFT_912207 [Mycena leptocephala]
MAASWLCAQCPKIFTRKGDLTRHSLLHTGYRPHSCSECGKSFAQYSGLKTHMNVHTRVKPFRCGITSCQAAFGDPSSCARHRKETHRRSGSYQCPESRCKSTIKRRSAFTAHLRKHGMKYAGLDIDIFYSGAAHGSRATTSQIALPEVLTIPEIMTYEPEPGYDSYTPEGMPAFPHDFPNDMDLHVATGELFTFNSRSPSSLRPLLLRRRPHPLPLPRRLSNSRMNPDSASLMSTSLKRTLPTTLRRLAPSQRCPSVSTDARIWPRRFRLSQAAVGLTAVFG